ncbi:Periplasmic zinc-binding protein TroA precursor [Maioricimonas rarisocia]|uniref:Periplasmic zinc-binding protein TroA n=1 Tax=Maioricimonas rarisocia TaxID=2528026 RepID=A0A517ZA25_9PLAN|nr:zinc ABC transporter substrate-binding protein [Maioricimonas rarisocia]QDU39259.1 Periplasmic zinc-binding protein TroA precursor [Maioricimonas rarisocia]
MKLSFVATVAILLACLIGCADGPATSSPATGESGNGSSGREGKIQAVATVGMVADLVRNVGGEHVDVTQIMGAGVDPHLYKSTRDDVATIMSADIVFYAGLMLEGKMSDTLVTVARQKPVYAVTELISQDSLLEPDDFAGHYDPHVWMDVATWSQCVSAVANALSEFDPAHAEEYVGNAEEYRKRLEQLHEYGRSSIASIPESSRVLITSHDAFNYFGRAYGLEVQGVQGLSTESEAGLQRINGLVDLLVERRVRAVFVESSVPRKNIEALVDGARSRGHEVVIGGELYSDAMGQPGTYEGTYEGMLDHNITVVTRSLGGNAPPGGLNNRLATD